MKGCANAINWLTYVRESLDQGDVEVVLDLGNPLLQVLLEEVLDLTGELDTGGTTANHDHVQQTLDLFICLVLEDSRLDAVHNALADLLGVTDLLQEARVLLHTGDAWKMRLTNNSFSHIEKRSITYRK